MDFNNFSGIEEFLNYLGYEKITEDDDESTESNESSDESDTSNCGCKIDPTAGASTDWCAKLNLDIPGGFQDINPILFITLGEVVGNIISGQLPYNVANIISNLIILVGQIIETCGTQQQYYEIGPGRYFNCAYKNIENPFCDFDVDKKKESSNTSDLIKDENLKRDKDSIQIFKNINDIYLKLENFKFEFNKISTKINELEKRIEKMENSK
ncbi:MULTISPECIES: hypothetical protein [Clostridium]|uniref:Uncharacterized protein n=2 Tax=Clostridium botulinum TaxID=1491 RepID=A0A6B4T7P9_CLOBO|nr:MULTISPECIES: hypothetical protein [Clostridium]ACD53110.1 conserved hypothetical protein [Clostridium botulinum E3 str. Alaska E43]AJF30030.1 hypothetical protein ST13_10125 [Clostridium botulinum]AJF33093.1 hypothetical protein ST12_10125 [Clostridium botulinum]EES49672.1 conserved hypothetical protein [Clostridium botulinum E1 str. 'BoNT E Beluga']KIL06630.1 hypothetical protein SR42_15940 [Clostridium botulinum]